MTPADIPPRLSPDEMPPFTDQASVLFARPGGSSRTAGDLAWARILRSICDRWPVHPANDVELRVAAPDDLAAAG
ncbi:hypothetical protein [Nocardioides aromaticivorans]|nr:hypothetical protein [Nocardioides aromaticivorans]